MVLKSSSVNITVMLGSTSKKVIKSPKKEAKIFEKFFYGVHEYSGLGQILHRKSWDLYFRNQLDH